MNILTRSAIIITHKKPYMEWHDALFLGLPLDENKIGESVTYLKDELSNNAGNVVKKTLQTNI